MVTSHDALRRDDGARWPWRTHRRCCATLRQPFAAGAGRAAPGPPARCRLQRWSRTSTRWRDHRGGRRPRFREGRHRQPRHGTCGRRLAGRACAAAASTAPHASGTSAANPHSPNVATIYEGSAAGHGGAQGVAAAGCACHGDHQPIHEVAGRRPHPARLPGARAAAAGLDEALAQAHALPGRRGIMVVSLDPAGPARATAAGVHVGVVGFDGEAVGVRSLHARLTPESIGKTAELRIVRAGRSRPAIPHGRSGVVSARASRDRWRRAGGGRRVGHRRPGPRRACACDGAGASRPAAG